MSETPLSTEKGGRGSTISPPLQQQPSWVLTADLSPYLEKLALMRPQLSSSTAVAADTQLFASKPSST